ncbi:MAG TPA: EpsI family protein [Chthoniobacteraceae bacterium]|nr:EpsI family protein [Chthoniobacteraceae bacterium]
MPTRLLTLLCIIAGGYSLIWVLPVHTSRSEPGVKMDLPLFVGDWVGSDEEVSLRERQLLGADTTFERKSYTNGRGQHIYVSIVLAGQDMNVSIHKPEFCLPAQGYTILNSYPDEAEMKDGRHLTMTRLFNRRTLTLPNQKEIEETSLDYYWFVGARHTTDSHFGRHWADNRDRLLRGENQPWAFVMVISRISKGLQPFGLDEKETEAMIKDFIADLAPAIHKPGLEIK